MQNFENFQLIFYAEALQNALRFSNYNYYKNTGLIEKSDQEKTKHGDRIVLSEGFEIDE